MNIKDIKAKMIFIYKDKLYTMIENKHKKMARSKAIIKCKMKNVMTGSIIVKTFNSKDNFDVAFVTHMDTTFLYSDNEIAYFLNNDNYEQIEVSLEKIQDEIKFLTENMNIQLCFYKELFIRIKMPEKVCHKIKTTVENIKQDNSVTLGYKSSITETGLEVSVPQFINIGEEIIISTSTGKYVERKKRK